MRGFNRDTTIRGDVMLTICRRRFGVPAICLITWFSTPTALAQTLYDFNLPPQPLADSLRAIGHQTSVNILFDPRSVEKLTAPAVHGQFSASQAVNRILAGTNLAAEQTEANTLLVEPKDKAGKAQASATLNDPPDDSQKEAGKKTSQDFRVAQVDQGPARPPAVGDDQSSDKKKKKEEGLSEIVVTGSRIPVAAGQETAQPVRIYTREDISRSGQTTIADFLNTLPDVSINNVEGNIQSFLGRTTVQLHGLPQGTTETLLNGRQIESSYYGFFDLGAIPAAAIERIDVLPVGSSAIYGSDALAGAVNMILRKDFNGLEFNAKYGRDIGSGEDDFSIAWGKVWDRASVTLVVNYQGRTELSSNDRLITSNAAGVPPAGAAFDLTDECSPGNVYSLNGQPLPGLGTATQAAIPAGIVGKPALQSFLATAGKINQCSYLVDTALIPPTQREGALLSAHYEISGHADLFAEVLFSHEFQDNIVGDAIGAYGGSTGYTTIAADNPYNPFGVTVGVSATDRDTLATYKNWQTFERPLVGLRGSIGGDWHYEVTTLLSQDQAHDLRLATGNQAALQAALNSSNPATALNPFTSGPWGSPQLLQPLYNFYADNFSNQLVSTQAIVRGTLFDLPSGAVQSVFGVQYNHEKLHTDQDYYGELTELNFARHSDAAFTEERIPLIANHVDPRVGERLALTLAGRYDKYSDFAKKTTGQAGLEWRPITGILFRAGYATSYKAPELQELAGGIAGSYQGDITDPFRGSSSYPVNTEYGANSALKPETGTSKVFGVVYNSTDYPGLNASLSYYSIELTNYISLLDTQVLVDYPALFPGAVTRAAPTPQDQQLGYLGVITNIVDTYYNYGDIRVAGIDFDVSHRLPTLVGDFKPSLALTDMVRYRAALTPGSADVSYLSQATLYGPGFTPRWKGTVALGWEQRALSANLTGRYIGPYRDYQDLVPNTNTLGNTWYCDLNIRYELDKTLGGGGQWYRHSFFEIGAVNLFDNLPKFSYGPLYDYAESDIRGRFIYAQFGIKL
jgi:iron complex outermembrane recepter protein